MTKIIVFTDLHMLPEGGTIIGIDPHARLKAGIDHVNRYHSDAERVVIMGDLAHHGDEASYRRLKPLVDGFVPPVSITIGNHDSRAAFRAVFRDAASCASGFVSEIVDFDDCRVVVLDTAHGLPADDPLHHAGGLCDARLDWLDRALASAAGRPVLIFMHHPPHDTGFLAMDDIKLINGEAFHDLIGRHGNVRHIFAGHVHRTIGGSHRGTPFSIFKSPVHQQPMPFDTRDEHASVDEPAAYGIVVVTAHGVQVHSEDYEIASRAAAADGA